MESNNSNLDELKKMFIIDRGKYEKEKLPEFIKRTLVYCKVDSEGRIYIEGFDLTIRDKIIISLIARFLANKMDPSIKSEMSGEEISTILDADKPVIFARLKDLSDIRVITKLDKGIYEIIPYCIEKLLNEIDNKYQSNEDSTKKKESQATKERKKRKIQKDAPPKVVVKDDFLEKIMDVDKSNYTYVYNLPSATLRTLAVLEMLRNEVEIEWVSSPQILKILLEKFRIKIPWSTVSVSLKELDQKAFVQSRQKKGHSTAREYRIMKHGEDRLKGAIEKLKEKNGDAL